MAWVAYVVKEPAITPSLHMCFLCPYPQNKIPTIFWTVISHVKRAVEVRLVSPG